jgi:hypothetical protein
MNPGYPGTFQPQMATKSRMVTIDVGYPSLTTPPRTGDQNPNPLYSVSEALKIARSVDSLSDTTLDPNMDKNEFVHWWDAHVNGIGTLPDVTPTQAFDMDVVLALIQFAAQLRGEFIAQYDGSNAARARNALPVNQPLTLREMRRCAYILSSMTSKEKIGTTPEALAKHLITTLFLSQIESSVDRAKIQSALDTWTMKKRLSA